MEPIGDVRSMAILLGHDYHLNRRVISLACDCGRWYAIGHDIEALFAELDHHHEQVVQDVIHDVARGALV